MEDYRTQRIKELADDEVERDEILRRRLTNPDEKKRFRNAYVFKVGVDYSILSPYCENIIVATEGYADHIDRSRAKLELSMKDYDPDKDLIVVIGRSFDNLFAGMIVGKKVLEKPKIYQSFAIAMYWNFIYRFYEVFLDPTIESHEIYIK